MANEPTAEAGETIAQPKERHDDGTPMTQDEIDEYWLRHVYRPNERQLTPRAVVTGMLLGGVMSLSNLYVGLKTGWGLAVTVTAAVLAFGIFSALRRAIPYGPFREDFTSLENNVMASSASAAGYFTGAGLTSAIPALYLATGFQLGPWQLAIWILAISFLGVLLAVPMRRQMIDVDRLPFPEGLAYAETIRSLHAAPGAARRKALALLWGAIAGAVVKIAGGVVGFSKPFAAALKTPLIPEHLPVFTGWLPLTLGFQTDLLMIGAGGIMGVRICAGLAIGSVAAFGVIATLLHAHGLAGPSPAFGTVRAWLVWPGVAIIVVNGLLAFGLKWRTALAALSGLGKLAAGGKRGGMAEVEVPTTWFVRGTIACTIFVVILAKVFFDIPVWLGLLAVVLSALLSIVACRATGETSITPIGALGKITQFMYGGLAVGNIKTNLMTASITAGAAMHSADLLTDLKGGYVLGGKPRNQFVSQFFGILAGAVFCIPAYAILATPERLGSVDFPAPAAKTWQAVAELLAGGVSSEVRGEADARAATARALALGRVPLGTKIGDRLRIATGPNAGEYAVAAVVDKAIVLDRDLPGEVEAGLAVTVAGRGDAQAAGPQKELPALRLGAPPAGTTRGDWVRHDAGGHALFWGVKGVVGSTVVVDRPIVDPRTDVPMPATFRVKVSKESLPPFALGATLVATFFAILLTLVETYAPKKVTRWVPSTTGLGLGFVIAGFDSISMFVGSLLAWAWSQWRPKQAEDYTLAGASGIMAGASLAGILIIVLGPTVVGILLTP